MRLESSFAARTRQILVAVVPPAGFRGRVEVVDSGHAVVSDGARFVVARAPPDIATGRAMIVSRDPKADLVVRPVPDRDRGS